MNWEPTRASGEFEQRTAEGHPVAPVARLAPSPANAPTYRRWVKPAIDRGLGLFLLVISAPALLVAALIVRSELGRPVFYRQLRVGKDGKEFELVKLRTMIHDRRETSIPISAPDRRQVHKSPADPRVPASCRRIRALRIDEIPQFWNVVKGDMSLVGPRPELPDIVSRYEPWQHRRHLVKPGITGPWQVSARNGKLMHECVDMDLEYVDGVTLLRDVSLLARTPGAMLGRRKGY